MLAASTTPLISTLARSSIGIRAGTANPGIVPSARMAAPTGTVAPPVIGLRFVFTTRMPGVTRPWTARIAPIAANATATSTVRASPRRTPTAATAYAASVANPAPTPTPTQCATPESVNGCAPTARVASSGAEGRQRCEEDDRPRLHPTAIGTGLRRQEIFWCHGARAPISRGRLSAPAASAA